MFANAKRSVPFGILFWELAIAPASLDAVADGLDAQAKEKPKVIVRSLVLKERRGLPVGGSGLTFFADQMQIAKTLTDNAATELAAQVDFAKEQVVWVQWTTMGPPYGALFHEIKDGEIAFYVQKPPGRVGQNVRNSSEFFAVPANAKVKIR